MKIIHLCIQCNFIRQKQLSHNSYRISERDNISSRYLFKMYILVRILWKYHVPHVLQQILFTPPKEKPLTLHFGARRTWPRKTSWLLSRGLGFAPLPFPGPSDTLLYKKHFICKIICRKVARGGTNRGRHSKILRRT